MLKEKTKFFIIPGFGEKSSDKRYRQLISFLRSKGFDVVGVPVSWKYNTLTKNTEEFKEFYNKNKAKKNYILGFSYGSIVSLMSAGDIMPSKLFLCSISNTFKEDLLAMSKDKKRIIKFIGVKRYKDSLKLSAVYFAKRVKCPTVVFYGEKEILNSPQFLKRSKETVRYIKNSRLVVAKSAPHDISFPTYFDAIKSHVR